MSEEHWDVPSDRLRRIATAASAPQFRECPSCQHRHPAGERCGYPIGDLTCRCRS